MRSQRPRRRPASVGTTTGASRPCARRARSHLPKNPRETDADHAAPEPDRLPPPCSTRSTPTSEAPGLPIVVDGAPGEVEKTLSNVDLAGNDLDMWAQCSLTCGLVDG